MFENTFNSLSSPNSPFNLQWIKQYLDKFSKEEKQTQNVSHFETFRTCMIILISQIECYTTTIRYICWDW